MSQSGSPLKLCPSSPIKSRNEVEWDKCIICQVSTPELLIEMRNVSKNSLIEAIWKQEEMVCFLRIVHSVSDIDNLRSDDTSMLYHRSCYKTYTSRRNCGFFKVTSAGSDHKPDTSQVPLLNEQTDDTSTDIALCIFCGKQTFKKDRKLHKIKTAERLQNVKDVAEGQNDYTMSGLLSNATFIDKAVYHSGCITQALVSFKNICPLLSLTSR
jgi:hypothetical protein